MDVDVNEKTGPGRITARAQPLAAGSWLRRIVVYLAPFALALAAYLAFFLAVRPDTTGDEPHYLLIAQSIAYDGDVDLTNDYASRDRTLRVVNVYPLGPELHAADYTGSGQLRPLHGVGLSAVLAPAVGIGGLTGARLAIVLLTALLAHQLYRLLLQLGFRRRYRVLAWAATALCLPLVAFSSQIYPEVPGALLIVVVVRIIVAGAPSPAMLALGAAASAAMVWLHVRYFPLSVGMMVGLAYVACAGARADRAPGTRDVRARFRAGRAVVGGCVAEAVSRWREITLPLVVPYLAVLALLAISFERWYGTPDPRAPYAVFWDYTVGTGGWNFIYDVALSDVLSPVYGWIPYVPVHWLGLAALGSLVVWFRGAAIACLAVVVGYELTLASAEIPIGWGLPARYLILVIPLIAIPIALAIQQIRAARIVFVPLLAVSLAFAALAVPDFEWLYPVGEDPRMRGVRSVATAFPTTRDLPFFTSFTLAPGQFPPQTGTVEGDTIVATGGEDPAGLILWGPNTSLEGGTYQAIFPLAASGAAATEPVATIEAVGSPPLAVFARKVVTGADLRPRRPTGIPLQFTTPGSYFIEARVYFHGRGTLRAWPVSVAPDPAFVRPRGTFQQWPLALLWIAGTVLVGALFVQVMERRRPHAS